MSVTRFRSTSLKARLAEAEAERNRLQEENYRLQSDPVNIAEWKRQEVVATTGAAIEIMEELTTKLGVVYANVAAIQGIFVNKTALNTSARTQREWALRQIEEGKNRAA